MNKICTSLEQSKKLIKLGIDPGTADMFWHKKIDGTYSLRVNDILLKLDTSAWSLSALINILPRSIKFKGDKYYLRFMKEYVEYANDEISITGRCLHTTGNDNLVDACYEMIVKLKENNLL